MPEVTEKRMGKYVNGIELLLYLGIMIRDVERVGIFLFCRHCNAIDTSLNSFLVITANDILGGEGD